MVYEVVEKKNAVNLQGLRGVFLYVENESKVGNKLPRTETILWLENIWRVSGSFEQSNFFFFFICVPGNASKLLKCKSVHWKH